MTDSSEHPEQTLEERIEACGMPLLCLGSQMSFVRNLEGYPFPHRMSATEAKRLGNQIARKVVDFFDGTDITDNEVMAEFVEPVYGLTPVADRGPGYHLIQAETDTCVLWIEVMSANHLTISRTGSGTLTNFVERMRELQADVDSLTKIFDFAYTDALGYLTAQPSLVGTGFRIRSWMHLAGLAHFGYLRELCNAAEVQGVLVELEDPENPPPGCRIILFNRFSLGKTTKQIAAGFQEFVLRVCEQENAARWRLHYDEPFVLLDILRRAKALIKEALMISEEMAMDLLSDIRLGYTIGDVTSRNLRVEDPEWFCDVMGPVFRWHQMRQMELYVPIPQNARVRPADAEDAYRAIWLRERIKFSISSDLTRRATE